MLVLNLQYVNFFFFFFPLTFQGSTSNNNLSQNHSFQYDEPIKVESVTQSVCDLALRFGEGADGEERIMSRPFGVALLIAGFDENGPQL